ncbi:MAG TPA: PIN domain-containing protein [Burkholderiales bacterium]|nr:PIN domain-containing protein [Burkholderiales bacterium]
MAGNALADSSFLIALLSRRDVHHAWAVLQSSELPPPWETCEAALTETFHVLGARGSPALRAILQRRALVLGFELADHLEPVLKLMQKYADVPMSLADACLVRMTETLADSLILTADADFRVYRRHGRQVVPCRMP